MKIEFDKALLWLVPYLYLVSILYYWGYWGSLGVDAITYYPASDFVKGIVNPISATTFYILGYSIVTILLRVYKRNKLTIWLLGIVVIVMVGLLILASFYKVPDNKAINPDLDKPILLRAWQIAFPLLGTFVVDFIESRVKTNKEERKIDYVIRLSLITFLLLFPLQAHVDGRLQAWYVLYNQEYDYTVIDSVAAPKGIYKYLGKAGDHHFLMNLNNDEHIIVSEEKLSPLIIKHYDIADESSKKEFMACEQKIKMPVQIKK